MSDQYTPMIEHISEEYDESDSNMVLELAAIGYGSMCTPALRLCIPRELTIS